MNWRNSSSCLISSSMRLRRATSALSVDDASSSAARRSATRVSRRDRPRTTHPARNPTVAHRASSTQLGELRSYVAENTTSAVFEYTSKVLDGSMPVPWQISAKLLFCTLTGGMVIWYA